MTLPRFRITEPYHPRGPAWYPVEPNAENVPQAPLTNGRAALACVSAVTGCSITHEAANLIADSPENILYFVNRRLPTASPGQQLGAGRLKGVRQRKSTPCRPTVREMDLASLHSLLS